MKKNKKVLVGGGFIVAAIVFLLLGAAPASSGVEATIGQLQSESAKYRQSNYLLVQGDIIGDSIEWDADTIQLRFKIKDEEGNILQVVHSGVKPDNFSEGIIAIVEGTYREDGVFEADRVKTRCPSKYEARDSKEYDPESHKQLNNPASGDE
ncbi:cytochrome c maturation protein CcmE [Paenibacillus sp. Dod16]|uniref:cytochrome c maturation protein CcmE n=1 Tax=Paenibacillus sp. Dod16 TaxID=3416392 RepID=UPI003CE7EB1D